jgi:glycosyltransferase involved in cell wall biosynthesis
MMLDNMEPYFSYRYKYSLRPWLRNQLLALQSKRSLRAADRVIAVSDHVKQILIDCLNVSPNHIKQIYHGRDTNFSPEGDEQDDNKILKRLGIRGNFVLTCGSLWPYRRCEDVIKAFDRYLESNEGDFSLVIAGSLIDARYGKVVKRAITESPNAARIHTVGHVPYETMQTLYRCCSLCVIATEVEACPHITIEAMSSGCAIVSSNQPPLPEIFRGCSMEFCSRNIEDLAFKMQRLVSDEQLRADLKRQALNRAKDFSWDRFAKQTYLALIKWEEK